MKIRDLKSGSMIFVANNTQYLKLMPYLNEYFANSDEPWEEDTFNKEPVLHHIDVEQDVFRNVDNSRVQEAIVKGRIFNAPLFYSQEGYTEHYEIY